VERLRQVAGYQIPVTWLFPGNRNPVTGNRSLVAAANHSRDIASDPKTPSNYFLSPNFAPPISDYWVIRLFSGTNNHSINYRTFYA